ncbi:hypothetical protein HC02_13020 [Vibrio parahaemolyticus]|nr:hypothetical protein HC02_13020 [Vibrio parahaemolyticus]
MNHNALYLTQRLIDTCLREDVFGILSNAKFSSATPKGVIVPQLEQVWLTFDNPDFTLYLPVVPRITCSIGVTAKPMAKRR